MAVKNKTTSKKLQKNAAKTVISKNKLLASKGIVKKKAVSNAIKGNLTRKNKMPSKPSSAKKSAQKSTKPSAFIMPNAAEVKKLYLAADKYLETFPAPKTVDAPKIKGFDLNEGVDYNKMFANLKF